MSQYPKHVIQQRVEVRFDYEVVFTRDLLAPDNHTLRDTVARAGGGRQRVLAVIDAGLQAHWPHLPDALGSYASAHGDVIDLVACHAMVAGEAAKQDPAHVDALRQLLCAQRMDRHALVIIFGGGAVLDAAGYAAATTHRGIRVIRVPTTVLGQNDAGVGVKNGINAYGQKNFIGTFAPPFAVLNDGAFLRTLQPRDLRAGIAEAVKVALIRDADFFEALWQDMAALSSFQPAAMDRMIERAAAHHLAHIAGGGDPFELGNARPLDFGHWSAHKLEALTEHRLRHGEAVAIGMALDCCYATRMGMLSAADCQRVLSLLSGLGFALHDRALLQLGDDGRPRVLGGLQEFREHLGGALSIPMLTRIGRATDVGDMDEATVALALTDLQQWRPQGAVTPDEAAACESPVGST